MKLYVKSFLILAAALTCSLSLVACGGGGGGDGGGGTGGSQSGDFAWETGEVSRVRLTKVGAHSRVIELMPGGIASIETDLSQSGTWEYQKLDANRGELKLHDMKYTTQDAYEEWSLELTFESKTSVRAEGTNTYYLEGNPLAPEDVTYQFTITYP